uniref:Uncharacterized protein n=1 Tax=Lactuca sativa TaxID=4236 RepID=A0A9R1XTK0_LACSA|nr:hypothetical protein LSAT_V11C100023130 [Lactuca sativa]
MQVTLLMVLMFQFLKLVMEFLRCFLLLETYILVVMTLIRSITIKSRNKKGWKELELALLCMRKLLEKSFIGVCKCLLKIFVSCDFLRIIFNISACYQMKQTCRTDRRMKVEITQDTELVEPLDEACIWRQTRGTATETLGAENKVESTEKVQLQFTNLPFCFLKYYHICET